MTDEVKDILINDKITFIIKNIDSINNDFYKSAIKKAIFDKKPWLYREYLVKYCYLEIYNDIENENLLYDCYGEKYPIKVINNKLCILITNKTSLPIILE